MKLISTDELNLELWKTDLYSDLKWSKSLAHTRFLTQPLKLEMFVPCKEGNVLEEPIGYEIFKEGIKEGGTVVWAVQCKEYQKAKDRVLFKGFEYSVDCGFIHLDGDNEYQQILYDTKNKQFFNHWDKELKTIQDLVHLDLELTENYKI